MGRVTLIVSSLNYDILHCWTMLQIVVQFSVTVSKAFSAQTSPNFSPADFLETRVFSGVIDAIHGFHSLTLGVKTWHT